MTTLPNNSSITNDIWSLSWYMVLKFPSLLGPCRWVLNFRSCFDPLPAAFMFMETLKEVHWMIPKILQAQRCPLHTLLVPRRMLKFGLFCFTASHFRVNSQFETCTEWLQWPLQSQRPGVKGTSYMLVFYPLSPKFQSEVNSNVLL